MNLSDRSCPFSRHRHPPIYCYELERFLESLLTMTIIHLPEPFQDEWHYGGYSEGVFEKLDLGLKDLDTFSGVGLRKAGCH